MDTELAVWYNVSLRLLSMRLIVSVPLFTVNVTI